MLLMISPKKIKGLIAAFTLNELLIASAISSVVVLGLYSFFSVSQSVSTKALTIASTAASSRNTLQKVKQAIESAHRAPTLTGLSVSASTSITAVVTGTDGSITVNRANGIYIDRFIGGPYILDLSASGTAGLTAAATTLTFQKHELSANPIPDIQDFDGIYITTTAVPGANSTSRRVSVSNATKGSTTGNLTTFTVDLPSDSPLGIAIPNPPGMPRITATLVRPVWIVAWPVLSSSNTVIAGELRYYEPYAASLNNYTSSKMFIAPQYFSNIPVGSPNYGAPMPFSMPNDNSVVVQADFVSGEFLRVISDGGVDRLNYDSNARFAASLTVALRSKSTK